MRYRLLSAGSAGRNFALVFDIDDDVLKDLQRFCERESIDAAFLCGIGGYRRATLGYYDMRKKGYEPIEIDEQVEVVSLIGNVTLFGGERRIHAHCTVGHRDGRTTAGHLLQGVISPTLEMTLQESVVPLRRTQRPEIGIPLIDL